MTDLTIRDRLNSRSVLFLTLWAEARGASVEARIAVGCVVRNRQVQFARYLAADDSEKSICLAPKQFSCWNGGDANYAALMAQAERVASGLPVEDLVLQECMYLADGIREKALLDNTKGATFYVETALLRTKPPSWVTGVALASVIQPFTLFKEKTA